MSKALALVLLLLASNASAAVYDAVITGATKTATQWAIKSPTATVSAGAVQTVAKVPVGSSTVNVSGGGISIAGGYASVPVAMQVASTAGQVAMTAIRLNPAGLVVGLTAQWLLSQGLQYANNQWNKQTPGIASQWCGDLGQGRGYTCRDTLVAFAQSQCATGPVALRVPSQGTWFYADSGGLAGADGNTTASGADVYCWWSPVYSASRSCKAGGTFPDCTAVPPSSQPASESDFTQAASAPLSDGAAGELVKVIDLPVNAPTFPSSTSVDASSAPYLDPVSGRMVKDTARITPAPTAENPLAVRVDRYQVDAGDVPGQTTAPPAPTKEASISNQPLNIEFPSDYARQGEAQTAANSINAELGPKIDKITETGADPVDPLQPQGSEFDQAFFQGTFTNLLGWQLPAHTSQCPTSGFDWNGQTYTINSHCQLVADHFSALSTVMAVVWTVLALFILLGA